jgi:hypothetical protein
VLAFVQGMIDKGSKGGVDGAVAKALAAFKQLAKKPHDDKRFKT